MGYFVDDVQILKNIFLTWIFLLISPIKITLPFFVCLSQFSCRSVAPDLEQYRWTTWEQQFLIYVLKSCNLQRTETCASCSHGLVNLIFERILYTFIIPKTFLDILLQILPLYLYLWYSFKHITSLVKWSSVVCQHIKMVTLDPHMNLTYFIF